MGTTTRSFSNFVTNATELTLHNENMYVFLGEAHNRPNESVAPVPNTSNYDDVAIDPSKNMLYGIKVGPSNMNAVIDRHDWASGRTYEAYHNDSNTLFTTTSADDVKPFFIYAATGGVYKCIDNNGGGASTVEPSHVDLTPREESDGYVWKYMYSVDPLSSFISTNYIPVTSNTTVQQNAVESIERITVENAGNTYVEVANGAIQSVTNTTVFAIESPTLAFANGLTMTPPDNFYNNTSILIYDTGLRSSGNLYTIKDYQAAGSLVTLDSAVGEVGINTARKYEISPRVRVLGDGTGATAIATVNDTTKGITGIEMKNVGVGYTFANVSIDANTGIGAVATAVISPLGGHGKRPYEELGADKITFNAKFIGDESGTVMADLQNGTRQVGLVINPSPANTALYGSVSTTAGSMTITGTQTRFDQTFTAQNLDTLAHSSVAAVNTAILSSASTSNTAKATAIVDLMADFNQRVSTTLDLEKIIIEGKDYRQTRDVLYIGSNTSITTLDTGLTTESGLTYRKLFDGDSFDQTQLLVVNPATSFTPGETIVSANNAQYGTVVSVSANNVYVVGTEFSAGTSVSGKTSAESSVVVTSTPNANSIDSSTGSYLYINNIVAVSKTPTSDVDINITVKV